MNGITLTLAILAAGPSPVESNRYFAINVVDEETGRGIPLVELTTTNHIHYYTDSNGVAAFYEPGLMNGRTFFHVKSHGYAFAKDGFGNRGRALDVTEGGAATLKMTRLNIAERLYRITGGGIYRDSILLGRNVPIRAGLLNGRVMGSDSVVNALYRGRIYWFWGDTNRPSYPLGNFHVPGATSQLSRDGGLDPDVGVDLQYFVGPDGFAKATAQMPGKGPTWIGGLINVRDDSGRQRLFASYVKVRPPMEIYRRGLVVFDDDKQQFVQVTEFDMHAPLLPGGHPFMRTVDGVEYIYFNQSFPLIRVIAHPDALADLSRYEAFTCLKTGSQPEDGQIDRDPQGRIRYSWKRRTPPYTMRLQRKLVDSGQIRADEALLQLRDADTGRVVLAQASSVYFNRYRHRFVLIASQSFGTSLLGEIWYAEADTPLGPWVYARKVVTHDKYSFYNPKQHPMFAKQGGRFVYFEGTYTAMFSGNPVPTPRYNYNQIMYKLDLEDPRLVLPVAVYATVSPAAAGGLTTLEGLADLDALPPIAFFALDRPVEGCVAVFVRGAAESGRLEIGDPTATTKRPPSAAAFYALPVGMPDPPATTLPLWEFVHQDGVRRVYSVEGDWNRPGYVRSARPLCRVWKNPMQLTLPRDG